MPTLRFGLEIHHRSVEESFVNRILEEIYAVASGGTVCSGFSFLPEPRYLIGWLSNGSKPTQQNPDLIGFDTREIYVSDTGRWKSRGCTQNYFTENKSCL